MSFKFEKLRVWQISMEYAETIYKLTLNFPKEETFNLTSQLRRAVDSVGLNISEGSVGKTNAEFSKFLGYSIRSLAEVVTCLYKAKFRDYVSEEVFKKNYDEAFNLMNQIVALRNSL